MGGFWAVAGGLRGEVADYVLYFRNLKLAVIEAKKRDLPATEGVGQAKRYAEKLQVRFTFSTNGVGIYRVDMESGAEGEVDSFPTPEELWGLTFAEENAWRDRFSGVPFEDKGGYFQPRYYQDLAIQSTLDAISQGRDRILLTLATGTGKTFIAFQLAWKLFHAKWNLSREPVTREERVNGHKDLIFSHYDDKQQAFLDFVLTQYVQEDVGELQPEKLPHLLDLKYHGIHDATEQLGDVAGIREMFVGFQRHLFEKRERA